MVFFEEIATKDSVELNFRDSDEFQGKDDAEQTNDDLCAKIDKAEGEQAETFPDNRHADHKEKNPFNHSLDSFVFHDLGGMKNPAESIGHGLKEEPSSKYIGSLGCVSRNIQEVNNKNEY